MRKFCLSCLSAFEVSSSGSPGAAGDKFCFDVAEGVLTQPADARLVNALHCVLRLLSPDCEEETFQQALSPSTMKCPLSQKVLLTAHLKCSDDRLREHMGKGDLRAKISLSLLRCVTRYALPYARLVNERFCRDRRPLRCLCALLQVR